MTVYSSPAVPPPKTSSILKGRISVESESSSLQGYIGVRCAYNEWCTITKTIEGAATFEVNLSDRTIKFQVSIPYYFTPSRSVSLFWKGWSKLSCGESLPTELETWRWVNAVGLLYLLFSSWDDNFVL